MNFDINEKHSWILKEELPIFIDDAVGHLPASEAVSTVMDMNGEPMKVFLCTDKVIEANKLKPVTNPISFVRRGDPSPDGIFSEVIFGNTQSEKVLNHAYIDLKHKFFHPYVYEILCQLHGTIKDVVAGDKVWAIKNGKFVEITDETDPDYNPNNTGLEFVIENYSKLKLSKNDSIRHNDQIEFLRALSENEIFITKWLVIPRFYRDFSSNGKMTSVEPINNHYTKLISTCNSLDGGIVGYTANKTLRIIQDLLVTIRNYGQQLIQKKEGLIHRSVLGRNTSFGSRGVISVPSLVGCDFPDDCQVNMIYTGLPLSHCIQAGFPFIMKWLIDWVDQNLSGGSIRLYSSNESEPTEVRIKDHSQIFDTKFLKKRLNMFCMGFGGRWEPIKVELEDGGTTYLSFTGRGFAAHAGNPRAATIANRPLTWCDLIYMAAEDTLSDKHVYCTRYPAEDYFNITPSRVSVLSTIKTMPMIVNGKTYQHYPVINPFEKESIVSRSFIDTISVSNLHLAGYRGDYDGDTVSVKMVFSVEANEEAEEKIMNLTNYMTINGNLIRVLGNESTLCLYNMTRRS